MLSMYRYVIVRPPWRELPEYDVIKRRTVLERRLFAIELSYMLTVTGVV